MFCATDTEFLKHEGKQWRKKLHFVVVKMNIYIQQKLRGGKTSLGSRCSVQQAQNSNPATLPNSSCLEEEKNLTNMEQTS